jgi:hypothetical protein
MKNDPKRFEDWEQVDCNECARYYDSSCDGVSKGSKKPCNSYLATRDVVIPERLKLLETRVRWLSAIVVGVIVWEICRVIGEFFVG